MPLHIQKLFPKITSEQLVATKNNNSQLGMCNKTTLTPVRYMYSRSRAQINKKKI